MPIPVVGWLFLILMGVVIPWAAIVTAHKMDEGQAWMSRGMFFAQVYISQLLLLGAALATWRIGELELPTDTDVTGRDWLIGAGALALVAGSLPWRFANMREERRERLNDILPQTRGELWLFYGVSLLAGIGEEIIYRGVLFALLAQLIGDWWLAALASSLLFGVAHATQGWVSGATIVLFSLGFHLIVFLTGGLWVAMGVHVLYDAFAGWWCGSWREGDGDGEAAADQAGVVAWDDGGVVALDGGLPMAGPLVEPGGGHLDGDSEGALGAEPDAISGGGRDGPATTGGGEGRSGDAGRGPAAGESSSDEDAGRPPGGPPGGPIGPGPAEGL